MQSLARDVGSGSIRAEDIDTQLVTARLDTGGIPDPESRHQDIG